MASILLYARTNTFQNTFSKIDQNIDYVKIDFIKKNRNSF